MPRLVVNGIGINYEDVGRGTPLLFLSCIPADSARSWAEHMTRYADGFRVIIPDLRGMGGSEPVREARPEDWLADVVGVLDALSMSFLHVCASRVGARIATRLAAEQPGRVKALVLDAPAESSPAADALRQRTLNPETATDRYKAMLQSRHGDDWPRMLKFFLDMHLREDFRTYYDLLAISPRVQAPTLVVRGDREEPPDYVYHTLAHAVAIHQLVPRSRLAIYPATPHSVLVSKPEEFWRLVRQFFAEVS